MVSAGGLEARSAALVLSGQQGGELDLAVHPLPLPDGSLVLWLALDPTDFPPPSESAGTADRRWLLEVHVYALGAGDRVLFSSSRAVAIDPGRHAGALEGGLIHVALRLESSSPLPPGETFSLRILCLERRSERFGLRVRESNQPRWAARGATDDDPGDESEGVGMKAWGTDDTTRVLLPPLALAEPDRGLLLLGEGDRPAPFPHGWGGRGWVPGLPWLAPGGPTPLFILGQALGEQVDLQVLDGGGQAMTQRMALAFDGVSEGEVGGTVPGVPGLDIRRLQVPDLGLEPGSYRLRLESGGRGVERLVRLARPAGPDPETEAEGLRAKAPKSDARQLADAYLRALAPLGRGDAEAARQAVTRFERRALAKADRALPLLAVEMAALEELARSDLGALVPLMVLHEALYRQSHREGDFRRATHSRTLVARLVEKLLAENDTGESRRLVADLLTSQAGYLLAIGSTLSARNALDAALEHETEHPEALLLMAAIDEALGATEAALHSLETLLATSGSTRGSSEARLRLGINRYRVGDAEGAEELLRKSLGRWDAAEPPRRLDVEEGPAVWITVIAHQELARLLLAEGRGDEAIELQRSAVERFPGRQRPVVQLAATLEARGRLEESRRLLRGLDLGTEAGLATPRLTYSRWPLADIEEVRHRLTERQTEAMPRFTVALAGASGGGEATP